MTTTTITAIMTTTLCGGIMIEMTRIIMITIGIMIMTAMTIVRNNSVL